jgi:hypothetical protein
MAVDENIQITLYLFGILIAYLIFIFLALLHTSPSIPNVNILDYIWILLVAIFVGRMLVPIFSPKRKRYMNIEDDLSRPEKEQRMMPIGKYENTLYDDYRSHSITLASFTMAIIAIVVAFPTVDLVNQNIVSLYYLSLAMVSFFISAYLFPLRRNRWLVYAGESLEYMGVVAVGIGLLSLILNRTNYDEWLALIYGLFLLAITAVAAIQIRVSIRFFYGR